MSTICVAARQFWISRSPWVMAACIGTLLITPIGKRSGDFIGVPVPGWVWGVSSGIGTVLIILLIFPRESATSWQVANRMPRSVPATIRPDEKDSWFSLVTEPSERGILWLEGQHLHFKGPKSSFTVTDDSYRSVSYFGAHIHVPDRGKFVVAPVRHWHSRRAITSSRFDKLIEKWRPITSQEEKPVSSDFIYPHSAINLGVFLKLAFIGYLPVFLYAGFAWMLRQT